MLRDRWISELSSHAIVELEHRFFTVLENSPVCSWGYIPLSNLLKYLSSSIASAGKFPCKSKLRLKLPLCCRVWAWWWYNRGARCNGHNYSDGLYWNGKCNSRFLLRVWAETNRSLQRDWWHNRVWPRCYFTAQPDGSLLLRSVLLLFSPSKCFNNVNFHSAIWVHSQLCHWTHANINPQRPSRSHTLLCPHGGHHSGRSGSGYPCFQLWRRHLWLRHTSHLLGSSQHRCHCAGMHHVSCNWMSHCVVTEVSPQVTTDLPWSTELLVLKHFWCFGWIGDFLLHKDDQHAWKEGMERSSLNLWFPNTVFRTNQEQLSSSRCRYTDPVSPLLICFHF